MQKTALIIDDEADIRRLAALALIRIGIDAHTAGNLAEGRTLLEERAFDVCLTDMRLPDGSGLDFLTYARTCRPEMPVAVITAHGDITDAVEAMRRGAFDFVSKPLDVQSLRKMVSQALRDTTTDVPQSTLDVSGRSAPEDAGGDLRGRERMVGNSKPVIDLLELVRKVSRTNAPVWITGESGTGKELIARMIHDNSSRTDSPFIGVNCGAIPVDLMESEFFGHRKGSFTGANDEHIGLFQRSHGGTLFLDEVAELSLSMQVKLLRAIQERRIRPVGAADEIPVDIRLLSASHKNPVAEVESGRFRHDLYYRLNVIGIRVPALRERREDIPAIAKAVLARISPADTAAPALGDDAVDVLTGLDFPGNVRELENLLERALALTEGDRICAADLSPDSLCVPPAPGTATAKPVATRSSEEETDSRHILAALERTRWNRKAAAVELGLTYRQLRYRIERLGIDGARG